MSFRLPLSLALGIAVVAGPGFIAPAAIPLQSKAAQAASGNPTLSVALFTLTDGLVWPYEMKQLQLQTVTELSRKDGKLFKVLTDAPTADTSDYTLHGEVLKWQPGNKAERVIVGVGTGRETAEIHYWLVNNKGKTVFDHTDTIRAAFWGNGAAESVGQLAQPFADKIADRLKDANIG